MEGNKGNYLFSLLFLFSSSRFTQTTSCSQAEGCQSPHASDGTQIPLVTPARESSQSQLHVQGAETPHRPEAQAGYPQ